MTMDTLKSKMVELGFTPCNVISWEDEDVIFVFSTESVNSGWGWVPSKTISCRKGSNLGMFIQ